MVESPLCGTFSPEILPPQRKVSPPSEISLWRISPGDKSPMDNFWNVKSLPHVKIFRRIPTPLKISQDNSTRISPCIKWSRQRERQTKRISHMNSSQTLSETSIPMGILHLENPSTGNPPSWKISVYFIITNTICKQWGNLVIYGSYSEGLGEVMSYSKT